MDGEAPPAEHLERRRAELLKLRQNFEEDLHALLPTSGAGQDLMTAPLPRRESVTIDHHAGRSVRVVP